MLELGLQRSKHSDVYFAARSLAVTSSFGSLSPVLQGDDV